VEREHVYRLTPLQGPPEGRDATASEALTFPAVQLFVERAFAGGTHLSLTDADAPAVAAICRRLDGDEAVDTLGDLPDEKAIVGRIS